MDQDDHDARIAVALHQRMAADRGAGRKRSLADYLAAFPGQEEVVAREYLLATAAPDHAEDYPAFAAGVGSVLGRYRLVRELGRGGQGVVFEGEDTRLGRRVAIKVLIGLGAADEGRLRRFRREAEIAAKLDHPAVCAVSDTGIESGVPYLVMRYVEGRTLGSVLLEQIEGGARRDGTRVRETVAFFEQLALGLHEAHELGIVHRDLKPGNVMVDPDGQPVLLDFGLARFADGAGLSITAPGDRLGTPAYMSPEQLADHHIALDRRTDVYSVGVTLYECLGGRSPFDAPSREAVFLAILNRVPPPLRRLDKAVTADLEAVVQTAMARDRNGRYATALELAQDLRRVLDGRPTRVRPVGPARRAGRWAKRNPIVATLGTFAAITLISFAVHADLSRRRAERDARAIQARNIELSRSADLVLARRLEDHAEALWPASPERADDCHAWLNLAHGLAARWPAHEAALLDVRGRARHASADEAVRRSRRERAALATLEAKRAILDDARDAGATAASVEGATQSLEEKIGALRSQLERPLLEFGDRADGARYEVCVELVELVRSRFLEPERGLIAAIEARLRFADTVAARSIAAHEEAWRLAIEDVAVGDAYGGLRLAPQLGLVPLGADPDSHLQEFLHLQTHAGEIPRRDDTGALLLDDDTGLVFVLLPGGRATLGASQDLRDDHFDPDAGPDEGPVHQVELDPFFIAKCEMTVAQWSRADLIPPVGGTATNHDPGWPITTTWHEGHRMLVRLDLAFPTEAQWEYAARAGTHTPWSTGADTASLLGAANLGDRSFAMSHHAARSSRRLWDEDDGWPGLAPVGILRPNGFGLHDVHGNVSEWVREPFTSYVLRALPGSGERLGLGDQYPIRGGNWTQGPAAARISVRPRGAPTLTGTQIGLRPMRPITTH